MKTVPSKLRSFFDAYFSNSTLIVISVFGSLWVLFSDESVLSLFSDLAVVVVLIGICELFSWSYKKTFIKEKTFITREEAEKIKLQPFQLMSVFETGEKENGMVMKAKASTVQMMMMVESMLETLPEKEQLLIVAKFVSEKAKEKKEEKGISFGDGKLFCDGVEIAKVKAVKFSKEEDGEFDTEEKTNPSYPKEINDLLRAGFRVKKIQDYQFRINSTLDIFPKGRKYHDIIKKKRGAISNKKTILEFVQKFFK